ncbi:MAG: hypothetical protein M3Z46_09235 [Actinomycetota bacterium]|nr:hypothetical protein [Actinomycetota bacterium]
MSVLRDSAAGRLAVAATVIDGVGAVVAHRNQLVGEPFGIRLPLAVPLSTELALWGSATSAPLVMDLFALSLARRPPMDRRRARASIGLGVLRLIGVACEPVTWGRRHATIATAAMVPCHLAIATSQIAFGLAALRPPPGGGDG